MTKTNRTMIPTRPTFNSAGSSSLSGDFFLVLFSSFLVSNRLLSLFIFIGATDCDAWAAFAFAFKLDWRQKLSYLNYHFNWIFFLLFFKLITSPNRTKKHRNSCNYPNNNERKIKFISCRDDFNCRIWIFFQKILLTNKIEILIS